MFHNRVSFDIAKDRLKHRVLALPSLRGGLLVHALMKIKKRTGVKWACGDVSDVFGEQ